MTTRIWLMSRQRRAVMTRDDKETSLPSAAFTASSRAAIMTCARSLSRVTPVSADTSSSSRPPASMPASRSWESEG